MNVRTLSFVFFVLVALNSAPCWTDVSADGVWSTLSENARSGGADSAEGRLPLRYRSVRFDSTAWEALTCAAPLERLDLAPAERPAPKRIALPMPDGSIAEFDCVESSIMHPSLAARFPSIRTYVGQGVEDPAATVRFDYSPAGFHAQVLSPKGAVYIDPLDDSGTYMTYYKRDYGSTEGLECLADELPLFEASTDTPRDRSGKHIRTYRLAVACTGQYAQFHGNEEVETVLAAIVTSINRVNGVFETELAIRFSLIADNDELIFLDPQTDPYTNNSASIMLGENQTVIDAIVGFFNYDIGHLFSTAPESDASLGVVCANGQKARGVSGSTSPINDPFDVDTVAHVIAHQFGATHTANGIGGECFDQRVAATAYEPGSGTTLMGLAGQCESDNVQFRGDPYFHSASFDQIFLFAKDVATCAVLQETGNRGPTADAGPDYVVPAQTPLLLRGAATDPDVDPLTYSWEELDRGPQAALSAPDDGEIPLFRSLPASASPTRSLPSLSDVRFNRSDPDERLPQVSREMKFRFSARDNRTDSGGVHFDDLVLTVDGSKGPFRVISPNGNESEDGSLLVAWDAAGTNLPPVSASTVDILLSVDDGDTFDFVLSGDTPNDGSETVTLPNVDFSTARIMVRASENVFYDMSDAAFTIGGGSLIGPARFFLSTDTPKPSVENGVTSSVITIPEQFYVFDVNVLLSVSHTWTGDLTFDLTAPDGTVVQLAGSLGFDGDNYTNTEFDDEASLPILFASPPFTGSFRPFAPLTDFDDRNAQGPWMLRIFDNKPADVGTLHHWRLEIVPRILSQLDDVWVDATYAGQELGTPSKPFNTLAEAQDVVRSGGVIRIVEGVSSETGKFDAPSVLVVHGDDSAVLGMSPVVEK